MNSLPALPNFAPIASLTLAELQADFSNSIAREMDFRELGQRAEAGAIPAEIRAAYLAQVWRIVRAYSRRTNACLAAIKAIKAAPAARLAA